VSSSCLTFLLAAPSASTAGMSIVQDKLGNEFLRNSGMDPNFAPGMLMFSHLPPVTSFTRLASPSALGEPPPHHEMVLKKERDSPPDHPGANGGFLHSMGIKQERLSELDYRMPVYASSAGGCGAGGGGKDMLEISFGNNLHHPHHHNHHQGMLLHDLSLANVRPLEPVRMRRGEGRGGAGDPRQSPVVSSLY